MSEGARFNLEERWQEVGRLMRRIDPALFEIFLAAAEAQAEMANQNARIDESYSEA